MFTGIIEGIGKVVFIERGRDGSIEFGIVPPFPASCVNLGDSISVDGVCLTVINKRVNTIFFSAGQETIRRTTLAGYKRGKLTNLERALRLEQGFGGHIVQGHIDCIGHLLKKTTGSGGSHFLFSFPERFSSLLVPQGSIAVDGISLTLTSVKDKIFEVFILDYTLKNTTMNYKKAGDDVNLEFDIIGKYIQGIFDKYRKRLEDRGKIELELLRKKGFM